AWKRAWRHSVAPPASIYRFLGYGPPFTARGTAGVENACAWGQAAQDASTLLHQAIVRGLPQGPGVLHGCVPLRGERLAVA
ncbi:hypothetical protein ACV334_34870, partial [Pseudomonas aeruginosa]